MKTDLRELFPGTEGLDDKSINALLTAIKNNYENGEFDYLKFKQSVSSLIELDMSENMAFKSAFTTAATLGLTREKLIKSAEKYIYALEDERESFAQAVLSQKEQQIDGRKAEVDSFAKKIEQHKLKIKELEREIAIFQQRIDNVDQDVETAKVKIEKTKSKFLNVYNILESDIKEDLIRIKKYI